MRIFSNGKKISDKEYGDFVLTVARDTSFHSDGSFVGYTDLGDIKEGDLFDQVFNPKNIESRVEKYVERNRLEMIHKIFMNEAILLIGEKLYEIPATREHKIPEIIEEIYIHTKGDAL